MRHAYSVIGAIVCTALLAGCSANKGTVPSLPTSHAPPHSGSQREVTPSLSREFVFVANAGSDDVSVFRVGSGGSLTEVQGSPFAAGSQPTDVGIEPSGKFAYVSNSNYPSPTGTISAYKVNRYTGGLTTVPGSPYTEGKSPYAVAVDPVGGKFVYVVNIFTNNISGYKVDKLLGGLTPLKRSPFYAHVAPESIAIDPLGRFLYVPNTGSNDINAYTIDAQSGNLRGIGHALAGMTPNFAAVNPAGTFLYVTNPGSDTISGYAIDQSTGHLNPISGSPFGVSGGPLAIAIDPTGTFAYVSVDQVGINAYAIDPSTGALTLVAGSPFSDGSSPVRVAVDPKDRYVYASNGATNTISAFALDPSTGALTVVAGSPFPTGASPSGVAIWSPR